MSIAKRIAEKMSKKEASMNSLGALDKKAMGIVEMLIKETYGKDSEMQEKMCNEMMKLAKMESDVANDFMEYMDGMASKYESKYMDEMKKKHEEEDEEDEEDDMEDEDGEEDDDKEEKKYKKKK